MIAIVSDIHSNIEALENVLKDIQRQNITEIICLGDVVGYGPNPEECIDIVRKFKFTIMGNHDEALKLSAVGFRGEAQDAITWTRKLLKPGWLSAPARKERWDFISELPLTKVDGDILFVHGSPREPTTEYILSNDADLPMGEKSEKLTQIFEMFPRLCFVGHTHDPGIITQEQKFISPPEVNYIFNLDPGEKYIINSGSVGQPRDGDNRSCYITVDGDKIIYHRIEYDYDLTKDKIYKTNELDKRLGDRLVIGH
ncbi:MAG: metallophosphoesterase [Candidatus Brocadiia bacterium]